MSQSVRPYSLGWFSTLTLNHEASLAKMKHPLHIQYLRRLLYDCHWSEYFRIAMLGSASPVNSETTKCKILSHSSMMNGSSNNLVGGKIKGSVKTESESRQYLNYAILHPPKITRYCDDYSKETVSWMWKFGYLRLSEKNRAWLSAISLPWLRSPIQRALRHSIELYHATKWGGDVGGALLLSLQT